MVLTRLDFATLAQLYIDTRRNSLRVSGAEVAQRVQNTPELRERWPFEGQAPLVSAYVTNKQSFLQTIPEIYSFARDF